MARFTATIAVSAALVAFLSGCGPEDKAVCGYVDLSKSTGQVRQEYLASLTEQLTAAAEAGNRVRVVVGSGTPLSDSSVLAADFADLKGLEKQPDRQAKLSALLSEVNLRAGEAEGKGASGGPGSGISAGIRLLAGNGACASVTAYTDGHENADVSVYSDDILTARGRKALVGQLREVDRVPDLDGAKVEFPYGGLLRTKTRLGARRQGALDDWWQDWAKAAGGSSTWGS